MVYCTRTELVTMASQTCTHSETSAQQGNNNI